MNFFATHYLSSLWESKQTLIYPVIRYLLFDHSENETYSKQKTKKSRNRKSFNPFFKRSNEPGEECKKGSLNTWLKFVWREHPMMFKKNPVTSKHLNTHTGNKTKKTKINANTLILFLYKLAYGNNTPDVTLMVTFSLYI